MEDDPTIDIMTRRSRAQLRGRADYAAGHYVPPKYQRDDLAANWRLGFKKAAAAAGQPVPVEH